MAVKIKNSLSTFLEQSLILERNSLETISKINDAMVSADESVTLTLTDPNNPDITKTYQIPSFGYLKMCIDRLDSTINTLTNVSSNSNSTIRLSDGTYRKLITSSIPSEAPTITQVGKVTDFNFKTNWFFEDMLNPCLYVNVDLTDQISPETNKVIVRRYILTCDTVEKQYIFDSKFKGQNNIDYNEFLNTIVKYKIKHKRTGTGGTGSLKDEDIRSIPPRSKRYSGTFSVINTLTPATDYNGTTTKTFVLSTLNYSDNRTSLKETKILTVGDYLELDTNPVTTRFRVSYVDTATNQVRLQLVEGAASVKIGDVFKISSTQDMEVNIEIPVGYDEREVIFIKPIDPSSNIPANDWSPGIGFYTNELTFTDKNGTSHTLQRFYQKYVVDFGQVILSYAKDYYPSLREGIKPNAPVLLHSNFKVVKINDQLTEYVDLDEFRKLVSEKNVISSDIGNINQQVIEQRTYLQTTDFVTQGDKTDAYNKLQELISKQNTLVSNYSSVVNAIKARTTDIGYDTTPKYRVRGFWEMPNPQMSASSGEQQVIKFVIRYRYRSRNGNLPKETTINVRTSSNTTIVGKISNWNEVVTKTRGRVEFNNEYVWAGIDISDPYTVKINQCDIPITFGEELEIQVKSISEAGWPSNPMESEWSNSVIITSEDFKGLEADNNIDEVIAQNRIDAAIAGLGVYNSSYSEHMSSSFYSGEKYFAHTAEVITSGFLTEEQTPISLYEKLQDIHRQLNTIVEKVDSVTGNLVVKLIDEKNNVYDLDDGSTTYICAGDYVSEVEKLSADEKKGAIITKTFQIDISSDTDSGLYIFSRIWGNRLSMCPSSKPFIYVTDDGDSDSDSDDLNELVSAVKVTPSGYHPTPKDLNLIQVTNPTISSKMSASLTDVVFSGTAYVTPLYQKASEQNALSAWPNSDLNIGFISYHDLVGSIEDKEKIVVKRIKTWDSWMSSHPKYVYNNTTKNVGIGTDKSIMYIDSVLYEYLNRYDLYENTIKSTIIQSEYYNQYGRYDLVPINLTNSDHIDYQIASPNMYQSAQCCGQFIYSRFMNIGGTFNMYANTKNVNGFASYSDLVPFGFAEKRYGVIKAEPIWTNLYPSANYATESLRKSAIKTDFEKMIGEPIMGNVNDAKFYQNVSLVLNRLPETYILPDSTYTRVSTTRQIAPVLSSGYATIGKNLRYTNLITSRLKNINETVSDTYTIKPKVQAAYGFGNIKYELTKKNKNEECVFLTTHKIGYEKRDRYATGETTCDSYLFLSPTNHKSIQVDGDGNKSSVYVNNTKSIKVPLVYQYRMTDYNGYIFGKKGLKSYDNTVVNTKYANIIGIDIWSDVLSDTPKQFDIIIYSTYGGGLNVTAGSAKPTTQQLVDSIVKISNNTPSILKKAQTLSSVQYIKK